MRPPQKFYYVFWAHGDDVMCEDWRYLKEECECVVGGGVNARGRRKAVCNW